MVAYQLFQKNSNDEALAAAKESLKNEKDEQTAAFARGLVDLGASSRPAKSWTRYTVMTALPTLTVIALSLLLLISLGSQKSGYAAAYTAPTETNVSSSPPKVGASGGRDQVNALAGLLASEVEAHATYKGQIRQGNLTTNQYVLDRAKYDGDTFTGIASKIRPYLSDNEANSDGFAASTYFNAQLLGLSIEIEQALKNGTLPSNASAGVRALGKDVSVSTWLRGSPFSKPYDLLTEQLTLTEVFLAGHTLPEYAERLNTLRAEVTSAATASAHHEAISKYNRLVDRYNSILKVRRGLDLAFNQCLDSKILTSKFDHVDLTSDAKDSKTEETTP